MSNNRHRPEGEMDDAIEVQGLEGLWPNELRPWRPNSPAMKPEPHMLRLQMRYRGQEFNALMARSPEGHRQIEDLTEEDRRRFDTWVEHSPGWWVRVTSPAGGSMLSSPYATLEAAVLGALSIPRYMLLARQQREEAL